jgi:hypothetical protein
VQLRGCWLVLVQAYLTALFCPAAPLTTHRLGQYQPVTCHTCASAAQYTCTSVKNATMLHISCTCSTFAQRTPCVTHIITLLSPLLPLLLLPLILLLLLSVPGPRKVPPARAVPLQGGSGILCRARGDAC